MTVWHRIKIGGGGYVTGIDVSPGGETMVCRTDTAGAYIWNSSTGEWDQLITSTSIPDTTAQWPVLGGGVTELCVAPSNPDILYMAFMGDIWKSIDRGETWAETNANWANVNDVSGNQAPRVMGQKIAIDPANPDVVYFGTPNAGVIRTLNGGTSWATISTSDIPACASTFSGVNPGHPGICFDSYSGTTGGNTNTIYVPVYGTGVYVSTDAGATWAPMSGAPTLVRHGRVASDGFYYVANASGTIANTIYRWNGSVWAAKGAGLSRPAESVIIDPNNAARVVALRDNGSLQVSNDRCDNWQTAATFTRAGPHIPWMAWTNEFFMSTGDCIFDPVVADKIWFAEGIGVWTTTFSGNPSSIVWSDESKGIENLTTNEVIAIPGGNVMCAGWDRSIFTVTDPDTYQSTHSPSATAQIRMAWDVDYATNDQNFVAYPSFWDGSGSDPFGWYSIDAGVNWTRFSTFPSGGNKVVNPSGNNDRIGGCIAVSTSQNIVIVPSNNGTPWYTKDGGVTWTEILISGTPRNVTGDTTSGTKIITNSDTSNLVVGLQVAAISGTLPICTISSIDSATQFTVSSNATASVVGATFDVETGWGNAYFNHMKCVAADKVTTGTFYIYNYLTRRCYRSTGQGDNWTQMNASQLPSTTINQSKMKAVPGQAGHLFIAGGTVGNPSDANPGGTRLSRSTDGGATWSEVTAGGTIREPLSVGFGAAGPGGSYPSVYFVGWLSSVFGIYRSIDNCASWTKIGDFPMGFFGAGRSIDASKDQFRNVYVTLGGASFAYADMLRTSVRMTATA